MLSFTAYTLDNASPTAAPLLQGIQAGYGFIPNLFRYMAEAPVTIEAYLQLNQLIAKSSLTPAQAQVALLAVSMENECGFCTVAHRAIGKKSGAAQQTLDALAQNAVITDPKDAALARLAKAFVNHRGWVADAELHAFLDAGFTRQQIFEVILIVTIKTLSNYTNHITQPEPNPELLNML